ncbi:MAG TPA: polysaccharide deacetylase family protein [Lacipirellula sp.]
MLLSIVAGREASAENWADRLGFPAGRKVVLLHANELGMCFEANAAAAQLADAGLVRSFSAMAPCPWFADAAQWRRSREDADVGLELTLSSEFENYRWKPVSPSDLTASLCDDQGYFWRTPIQTMVNGSAAEAEQELIAQIDRAKKLGLNPTHLTTHLGAMVTRPDLIEAYLRIARRHWVPAVVVELTPEQVARFEQQGYPLPDDIIELLSDYPLPKVDDLQAVPAAETYDQKKEGFLTLLDELAPGITQIAFRPAIESDALPRITGDWQQRNWDAQLLADPDVAAAIRDQEIVVTDWKELMRRFEGAADEEVNASDSSVQAKN